jgi:hypothetical protein
MFDEHVASLGAFKTSGVDRRVLVREESLELHPIRQRHVDRQTERWRAVDIEPLTGHQLEEISSESVTTERSELDGLRLDERRRSKHAGSDNARMDESRKFCERHSPSAQAKRVPRMNSRLRVGFELESAPEGASAAEFWQLAGFCWVLGAGCWVLGARGCR